MRTIYKLLSLIFVLLLSAGSVAFAQNKSKGAPSKEQFKALLKQADTYKEKNLPDGSVQILKEAKRVAHALRDSALVAKAHIQLADIYYWDIADYHKCKLELDTLGRQYLSVLSEKQKCRYLSQYGDAVYYDEADFVKSVHYYFKALEYAKKDSAMLARIYHNIGWVYTDLKKYDKGIEFGEKAVLVAQKSNGDVGHKMQGLVYIYKTAKQFRKAIALQRKLLAMDTSFAETAFAYYQLMGIYTDMKRYDSVLYLGESALILARKANKTRTEMMILRELLTAAVQSGRLERFNLHLSSLEKILQKYDKPYDAAEIYSLAGEYYLGQKDYKTAKTYLDKAKKYQEEYKLEGVELTYQNLADWHHQTKDHERAYEFQKRYSDISDSMLIAVKDASIKAIDNYNKIFDLENELNINETEIKNKNLLLENEKTQKRMVLFGLIGVFIIAVFLVRIIIDRKKMNKVLLQKNQLIELKNELLSTKNKEVHDSISYAKRLQEAILPSRKLIKKHLKNSFVLYKPKDIVAGDFYWMETSAPDKMNDDLVFFAAADCTGHGVPGAMVSVVCSNALNRVVKEFEITDPGKILDRVRELVVETFAKSESEVKDGMDISLCALNTRTKQLKWAGANNPLWQVRKLNNAASEYPYDLIEFKPDKQPIGKHTDARPFTTHTIDLQEGDTLYVFTDGYSDQFGGEKGKKFKTSNLKKLLLSIQDKSMEQQHVLIDQHFEEWRGPHEQVDDVCIIGIRL